MATTPKKAKLQEALLAAQIAEAEAAAGKMKAEQKKLKLESEREAVNLELERRELESDTLSHWYNRTYYFLDAVTGPTADNCISTLAKWARQSPSPIRLVINSPGGGVIDGLALYDTLLDLRAKGIHITVRTIGMAASMGGILLQAGDERLASPNSFMLIHEVATGAGGKISELEDEVAFSKRLQEKCVDILAERSILTSRQIKTRWARRDWWLDAQGMLEMGFVDRIE